MHEYVEYRLFSYVQEVDAPGLSLLLLLYTHDYMLSLDDSCTLLHVYFIFSLKLSVGSQNRGLIISKTGRFSIYPTDILEEKLEDDSHADTCLLSKIWRTLIVNDYSARVYGFSEDISQLELPIVDVATIVSTED